MNMPLPMDIMVFVTNRLLKEEMNKRKYTYEEHKEIEMRFHDFYDAVMCQGERIRVHLSKDSKKEKKVVSV